MTRTLCSSIESLEVTTQRAISVRTMAEACSDDMRTCFPLLMRPRFDVNVTGKEDESTKRRKDGERGKGSEIVYWIAGERNDCRTRRGLKGVFLTLGTCVAGSASCWADASQTTSVLVGTMQPVREETMQCRVCMQVDDKDVGGTPTTTRAKS